MAQVPADVVPASFESLRLVFNEAIDRTSFDPATDVTGFQGPSGSIAISGHSWIEDHVLELTFDRQTAIGNYAFDVGP